MREMRHQQGYVFALLATRKSPRRGGALTLEKMAKERLDHLNAHGPSDFAFGWVDLPSAKAFLEKKCA